MINIIQNDQNYYIDNDGMIYLSRRRGDIRCEKCNNILGIIGERAVLMRTTINVIEFNENLLISRCGKCKNYNTINLRVLSGE